MESKTDDTANVNEAAISEMKSELSREKDEEDRKESSSSESARNGEDTDEFSDLPELIDADELNEDENTKEEEKKDTKEKEKVSEELDADGYFDILDNRQLLKKVLREGNKEIPRPERGNKVTIKLITKFKETDQEIKSFCHDEFEMFIGDYDTIHGIDLLIPMMYVGEISEIIIAPRFGYGEKGLEPDIPPNTTLKCIVELITFEYIDEFINSLSLKERNKFGSFKKERGNFWLKREDYSIAGQCYKRSIEFLDLKEEEMKDYHDKKLDEENSNLVTLILDQRTAAYNNLSIVHMKQENYEQALKAVNSALMHDEKNIKALYRKAKILSSLGEYSDAIDVLRNSLKLNKEEKLIQSEINKLLVKHKNQLQEEKKLYQRMLNVSDSKVTDEKSNSNCKGFLCKLKEKWIYFAAATAIGAISATTAYFYHQQHL